MRVLSGVIVILSMFLHSKAVLANEWERQVAGLDGIATWCVDHADGRYGPPLCKKIQDHVSSKLSETNQKLAAQGYFRVEAQPEGKPEGLNNPLNLVLIIRGTAGSNVAIQLRWRVSVSYTAAVESGESGEGRAGELVMHEKSITGSGPIKGLEEAIGDAMVNHITGVMTKLAPALKKEG